ncbi:MAG: 3-isopropylmalate dehydratase small subunit [Rhodanobacteraceae bacterium]|jgi:3-isopropylmalate/(R)-2-methylmalate dehydratase small subunit|nr:3-isopropylmalate dehydratase small subunit [Rhodanobacteraceae bacterium]
MNPITSIRSTTLVLPQENIDTDQIIPARFLTTTERTGLGRAAFYDWRHDADGTLRADALLNQPEARSHAILVAGRNFGCGSSREHAPWALLDYGFQAVISSEIADIFRSNALKNGLVAIVLAPDKHAELLARPGIELSIDLESMSISGPDGWRAEFTLDAFARRCLMMGVDQLGYLLAQRAAIEAFEGL